MTRPKKPKPRRTRPDAVVGARMAQAREAAGKIQADMAYDLRQAGFGTAESSISAWENGHQDLYAMHLREWCRITGASADEIMGLSPAHHQGAGSAGGAGRADPDVSGLEAEGPPPPPPGEEEGGASSL